MRGLLGKACWRARWVSHQHGWRWLALALLSSTPMTLLAAATPTEATPHAVTVQIEGIDGEPLAAARTALSLVSYQSRKSIGAARLERLLGLVPKQIADALEVFGYYHATAQTTVTPRAGDSTLVQIQVDRGAPVRVAMLDLKIEGAAGKNRRIRRLLAEFAPAVGAVFDHRHYEQSKARIERALLRRGYFDQQLIEPRVEIRRETSLAEVRLHWRAGTRYLMGTVTFEGGQFSDAFLQRYIPWQAGDRYDQQRIEALQQALAAANYFSMIEVIPDLPHSHDLQVPIRVRLTPAKRTAYNIGLSYETDIGFGVRTGVERRWLNRHGQVLAAELSMAEKLTDSSVDYRIPRRSGAEDFYLAGVRYRDENTSVVDARSTLFSAGTTIGRDQWNGALSVNALTGSFLVGSRASFDPRRNSHMLYPELNVARFYGSNRVRPEAGASLRVTLRAASSNLQSSVDLLQIRTEARGIAALSPANRILLRAELGATETNRFSLLPPELRFFAGGDRSVRGYAYQSLGDRDAEGTAIGGRFLTTFSSELEHTFLPGWSAAVFFDGGDVFSHGLPQFRFGTGVGLRWASPVGPIRVDIGHGLNHPDSNFELHISAGPDL
ncbi:MAG: hypothetical protein COS34_02365 [Lysobacterales bacterium CG02_land_8_20_14_3_00_62_12]|nr:MAG: hypothetical protein COS34_02365 [Xanthomonadales bacterium CG02_land_8_20_14_3_00_62_12]